MLLLSQHTLRVVQTCNLQLVVMSKHVCIELVTLPLNLLLMVLVIACMYAN